jgi:hypothetical protein
MADWNGDPIATSISSGSRETVDVTLSLPGSYYLFVQAPTRQFSVTAPYTLTVRYTYGSGVAPEVLYSNAFFGGGTPGIVRRPVAKDRPASVDVLEESGRFTIAIHDRGTNRDPVGGSFFFGPRVSDFTLTVDVRAEADTRYGYRIGFRDADAGSYALEILSPAGGVDLDEKYNGKGRVTGGLIEGFRGSGGVNRFVVQSQGNTIRVSVNGELAVDVADAQHTGPGSLYFGAWTNDEPNTVYFDNVLVTSPTPMQPQALRDRSPRVDF